MALFYCIIFPVGNKGSLSNFLFKKDNRKTDVVYANICLTVLQVHMCIIYFFSGFDKILGFNWWNGESIWKALHLSYSPRLINVDFLSGTPIFAIVGWGTIVLEMLYPVFMNIKRTRNIWLILVISLHVSIAIFLGLFFFSAFMIILSISAYYIPFTSSIMKQEYIRKSFGNENSLLILYDSQCNFCRAFISKLSLLDVNSGNFNATDLRSAEARKILKDHGVDFVSLNTIYCVFNGQVNVKSRAIFLILSFARKPWCYLSYFEKLPRFLTDCVYTRVARSRYLISRFFIYV
jgi:predicted DCC family thiol-disulfide oxidoreductase YuxK